MPSFEHAEQSYTDHAVKHGQEGKIAMAKVLLLHHSLCRLSSPEQSSQASNLFRDPTQRSITRSIVKPYHTASDRQLGAGPGSNTCDNY